MTRRFAEVRFDGVTVPAANLLPGGEDAVDLCLSLATVLQSAESVGAAELLFEETVDYAKKRVQFGRTIGSFQAIKHRFADLLMELEAMRAAAHYAALALGDGLDDAAAAVATAGAYVDDTFAHICGEALQLHGGIGFTWEHDVHLFTRRAKVNQVLYGDGAWHRERLVRLTETGDGGLTPWTCSCPPSPTTTTTTGPRSRRSSRRTSRCWRGSSAPACGCPIGPTTWSCCAATCATSTTPATGSTASRPSGATRTSSAFWSRSSARPVSRTCSATRSSPAR